MATNVDMSPESLHVSDVLLQMTLFHQLHAGQQAALASSICVCDLRNLHRWLACRSGPGLEAAIKLFGGLSGQRRESSGQARSLQIKPVGVPLP